MTADEWNAKHPPGTPVIYYPIMKGGQPFIVKGEKSTTPVETETRSEAWQLGGGIAVVSLVGKTGGVRLEHLEVREATS